jgi:agmatinase
MNARFLASELPDLAPEQCLFQVLPVPFEASVSYGHGTALGPGAILEASSQLEVWTGRNNPAERGICTWPAVNCAGGAETVLKRIAKATARALAAGGPSLPVLLGGEHTVTLGALRAMKDHYGPFGVVQFDAHADLRDSYAGTPYSHACVMRRAVADLALPLFQIGVRSLSPEEVDFRKKADIRHLDARDLAAKGGLAWLAGNGFKDEPLLPPDFPRRIFLTFDVDALDSGLMPATGTPEPGGLSWHEALFLVRGALAGRMPLGFDVTELAPLETMPAPTFAAARLVYELMGECLDALAPTGHGPVS